MANIQTNQEFISKLKALPVAHQHRLAKLFISGVVHLSGNSRVGQLVELLAKPECSDDDVRNARTIAQSVYAETSPGSDISEFRFDCQATHFIAQAVLACTASFEQSGDNPLVASKVANYCRMAQTCAGMSQGEESPDFSKAEEAYEQIVREQIDILNRFLEAEGR
jgi:hypothetical protein